MQQAWRRLLPLGLAMLGEAAVMQAQEAGLSTRTVILGATDIPELAIFDRFGESLALLGDLDGDGIQEVAVGSPGFEATAGHEGAVFVLYYDARGALREYRKVAPYLGGFDALVEVDRFGESLAALGDLDGDGITELAVGTGARSPIGSRESVWILFLDGETNVKSFHQIAPGSGGFTGGVVAGDSFGASLAALGDLNEDGVIDLAVGAPGDDDGATDAGAVWLLFLAPDGTVATHQKISRTEGGFTGRTTTRFGTAVAALGDSDVSGGKDVAVGALDAVWILQLGTDGTVASSTELSRAAGTFPGDVEPDDEFGSSVSIAGDVDGNGVLDLLVGAGESDNDTGAVWILLLEPDGDVRFVQELGRDAGELDPAPRGGIRFGSALLPMGDLDGNGVLDYLFGAAGRGPGTFDASGRVWRVFMGRCSGPAIARFRNPFGTNPASLSCTPPIVGQRATATIDLALTGHVFGTLLAYLGPAQHRLNGGQWLLVDGASPGGELLDLPLFPGPSFQVQLPIPETLALCGFRATLQALQLFGAQPFALSNAIDLTVGR